MIDVDAFRAAAEPQEAMAPLTTSFTVPFDEAEAATVRRLAAMAGVSPQLIVQRLATGMPFRSASMNF